MRLLIAGLLGGTHIGGAFLKAAKYLDLKFNFVDIEPASAAPKWLKRINWHLRGKYPSQLEGFSQKLVWECENSQPELLISTGIAPINQKALLQLDRMGIKKINFLTDDPWNTAHYAPWFLKALPHYDIIFSPRRANINELVQAGCPNVEYLPFGFDRELFYPEEFINPEARLQYTCDVVFAGGGDCDRLKYMSALINSGINVNLYGGYWDCYPETKAYSGGIADVPTLRLAIASAKIALCLVRKANRDGNCMRTFEVPAIGACMLTEDTPEHREIFGEEGEAVLYFQTIPEMLEKVRWLLNHDTERQRLAQNAHSLIFHGKHTYKDRLETMLSLTEKLVFKK
ncbi:MAG: glycosyltransferase [Nostoc sp. DedVER02]|uniref:CgeB family protein n=1 Tax=unclassified Nostoc TaxID=2593658 RepID=UPI002AD5676C|nr:MULTISPECIES: glycosyltransferase [unclassified Nostoc]MDZ7988010.1 glycosyltransferase [Nostoc sp. DedVER02]MDZ8114935.1 glycosyltransferase [Nostoc sp. DedVER01b]